jgi:hypothetical protein
MFVDSNPLDAQHAPETPREPQLTMTVYMLLESEMNCLLVTNEQLMAVLDLLNAELDVVRA